MYILDNENVTNSSKNIDFKVTTTHHIYDQKEKTGSVLKARFHLAGSARIGPDRLGFLIHACALA